MSEELLPWMLQFQSAKTWINTIRAENTKNMYLKHLKRYCDAVNKNPDELIEFKIDGLRNVTTPKEFHAEALLNNYLFNSDLTATIQVLLLASVKSFYKANWRELNSNVGKASNYLNLKNAPPNFKTSLNSMT
jgi:hypothetical protein